MSLFDSKCPYCSHCISTETFESAIKTMATHLRAVHQEELTQEFNSLVAGIAIKATTAALSGDTRKEKKNA